ncbi:MAG TPA: DUF4129 domain-containing protein [Acidimicrobiales bacterium]|nr:DUF4129 domain-containing protein [Acidimicrobiales bacterium]
MDPEAARRAADEILSRPEYVEPQPTIADRVLEWVGDLLGRAVGALTGSGAGGLVGTVVVVVLLAGAGWLLARALRGGRPGRRHAMGPGIAHGTEAPDDPAVWAAEAARTAAAGDHRQALRCRYQELVAHLVRDRVVPADPSRTPRELAQGLGGRRPDLAGDLDALTQRFEETWYGGAHVDASTYERFAASAERTRAAARTTSVGVGR